VSFIMEGNKQDGKRAVELQSACKWTRAKIGPPKGFSWQVPMEDWIIDRLPWGEWWLKKKGN